jgi:hypothetical protein
MVFRDLQLPSKCVLIVWVFAIAALSGCHKRSAVVVEPPRALVVPTVVVVTAPIPIPAPIPTSLVPDPLPEPASPLEEANRAFAAGNYDEAIRLYESYLVSPSGEEDEALFRLALSYSLRSKPGPDWQRARDFLKQLITDYPESPLKSPATLIVSLRSHADQLVRDVKAREQAMRQLSAELERLKQIDTERRRRPQ